MKRLVLFVFGMAFLFGTIAEATMPVKGDKDKLIYFMGVMTGKAFKNHDIKINPQFFSIGLSDGYLDKKTQMTDQEIRQTLEKFQKQSVQKLQAQAQIKNSPRKCRKGKVF